MKERTILHVDVNNFFASVECSTRPQLKDLPVAVTGNPKKRTGIILAKNELAKKMGVKTGQAIWEAKNVCPNLVCLPPHYDLYQSISTALHAVYLEYTDRVEPLGLDECWLDVTGCEQYLGKNGKQIADEIRQKIRQKFNFTVSVGVSFNKIFAKLGSDLRKPDATTIIDKQHFKAITYDMPLNSIVGIGRRLETKFNKINVFTIGQFVQLEDDFLKEFMSITGVLLKKQLLGIDETEVLSYFHLPLPKSVGNGTTAIIDISTKEEISKVIYFLAEKISKRLIALDCTASTLGISVKTNTFSRYGKSQAIPKTNQVAEIASHAIRLLDSFWQYTLPVRAIRIRTSNLQKQQWQQLDIFHQKNDSSNVIYQIEQKYGHIALASDMSPFINNSKHPHED